VKVGTKVGHTFIGLTKIENGKEITQYLGFYPTEKSLSYPIDSKMVDNAETDWTVSVSFDLNINAFNDAIESAKSNSYKQYHISEFNCTTYALNVCSAAGLSLPKNPSEFPYNYGLGLSPRKLGYDLRNSTSNFGGAKNFSGGQTSSSKGPCQ
jgi:hypothetical protein